MMKKRIKWLIIVVIGMLGIMIVLFGILVLTALMKPRNESQRNQYIKIEYTGGGELPNANIGSLNIQDPNKPELIYKDTMEEALIANADYYFRKYPYMNKVSDVIKLFENEEYATMFYHSVDVAGKREGLVASKFKKRIENEKTQYALTLTSLSEFKAKSYRYKNELEYDFMASYSITEGERFFWGSTENKQIEKMRIEGQSPDEVIEYTVLGKPEYLWYYENIISDKPSSEFKIELEE